MKNLGDMVLIEAGRFKPFPTIWLHLYKYKTSGNLNYPFKAATIGGKTTKQSKKVLSKIKIVNFEVQTENRGECGKGSSSCEVVTLFPLLCF